MIDDDREARVRRVNAEARETIERVSRSMEQWRDEFEKLPALEKVRRLIGEPEDAGLKWRAEMAALAAERERARAKIAATKPALPDWDAIDARIQEALAVERQLLCESFGAETGRLLARERRDVMKAMRDELRELKNESVELRRELALERGRVVDLPALPPRRSVN